MLHTLWSHWEKVYWGACEAGPPCSELEPGWLLQKAMAGAPSSRLSLGRRLRAIAAGPC